MTEDNKPKSTSVQDKIPGKTPETTGKEDEKPSVWVRTLPLLILTGGFAIWGLIDKIPVKVVGQSIITIPRSRVNFQARSSGRVIAINVQPGDIVKKGQVLGLIEAEEVREELLTKQQELAEYEQENVEITEIEGQRSQLKRETIQQQKATIPLEIEANNKQIESNQEERVAITRQRETYKQRIDQINTIDQLISQRFEAYDELVEEGAVAPLDPNRIQAEDVLQRNLNEKTQLSAKLEDLSAKDQQLLSQNESLRAQNENLKAQLENLTTQAKEITLDDLQADIQRQNNIDNLKREISNIQVKLNTTTQVVSPNDGEITEIAVNVGQYLQTGTTLGTLKVQQNQQQPEVALAFFTPENADRLQEGMLVEVTPNLLTERRFGGTRERYGGIKGTITTISPETITPQEAASLVGNEQLAETLLQNPVPYSAPDPGEAKNLPVVQVQIQLEQNSNNPTGYEWMRGKGPNVALTEGAIGESRVTLEKRTPVSYILPLLRWITGIYG